LAALEIEKHVCMMELAALEIEKLVCVMESFLILRESMFGYPYNLMGSLGHNSMGN
jgi:hypothetical protein